jgi:hypothetical protein
MDNKKKCYDTDQCFNKSCKDCEFGKKAELNKKRIEIFKKLNSLNISFAFYNGR